MYYILLNRPITQYTKNRLSLNQLNFLIEYNNLNTFSLLNKAVEGQENLDLRMLRSFRVLRPLKVVARTPSK